NVTFPVPCRNLSRMATKSLPQHPGVTTALINNLPTEILDEIFTLYYRSKIFSPLTLKLVCQQWCQIVDRMSIVYSDILLAPDLGQLPFELTVIGCRTCFREADVYDTELDKDLIDLRCRSLNVYCPVVLAAPLIKSINNAPNLESFKAGASSQDWDRDDDEMHIAINHVLLKKPRLLRKLGLFHVNEFELDESKREVLRCLDSCMLRGTSLFSDQPVKDLVSGLENVTKIQWKLRANPPPPIDHAQAGGTIGRRKRLSLRDTFSTAFTTSIFADPLHLIDWEGLDQEIAM
ncbi:9411_t:CDS:2, partial [Acaulospora colombiana]